MVSEHITDYLKQNQIDVEWVPHDRAITATRLAQKLHVSGRKFAKTVICKADDAYCICLIPANSELDLDEVAEVLGADNVRLADEDEFNRLFPDCEPGSEPPFGHLYQLPVLMDDTLAMQDSIIFRGGSHEDAMEMSLDDFRRLEAPRIASLVYGLAGGPLPGRGPGQSYLAESQQG